MPQKPVIVCTELTSVPLEWVRDYPSSPEEAFEKSVGKYFASKPCSKGHYSLRIQAKGKDKGCVTCTQLKQRDKTKAERATRGVTDYALEDFIRDANLKHGEGRYDYGLIEQFNRKTDEYWIICPDCCCFKQRAAKHVSGQGCNKCSLSSAMRERRMTQKSMFAGVRKYMKVNMI